MKLTRKRLFRKLLLLLLLPPAMCIGGYGLFSTSQREADLLAEAARELMDEAAALRVTLPEIAADAGPETLKAVAEGIARGERVHGIAVYDRGCKAIARSADLARHARVIDAMVCDRREPGNGWDGMARFGRVSALVRVEALEGVPEIGHIAVTYNLDEVEAIIRRGTLSLIATGMVLLLVMGGVALFITKALAGPLGGLIDAADRVGHGDLGVRVPPARHLGLDRVVVTFNTMVAGLAAARTRVDRAEAERRALEQRILHGQALTIVGQLAASLAHEIGSPLSTLLGWARMTATDEELPPSSREQATRAAEQCERITRILRRMMTVARPGGSPRSKVALQGVVSEVTSFLEPECKRLGIRVRCEAPPEEIAIEANRDHLVQVLLNLCMNALQAQPDGGQLVVALCKGAGRILVEVRDAGPGVAPELRGRIFESFYTTRGETGGTGLGLALVARIAEDLGGEVSVGAAAEGGASFLMRFPIEELGEKEAPAVAPAP